MNKKVLTLCAGLVLAGGLFNAANASHWTTDTRYVQNSGKYHLIKQVADFDQSASGDKWTKDPNNYYITVDEKGVPVFAEDIQLGDKKAYWTVKTRTESGQTEYQLVNAEGTVFTYTYKNKAGKDVPVQWFLVKDDSSTGVSIPSTLTFDFNWLYFYDEDDELQYLTAASSPRNGTQIYDFEKSTSKARGFNNVEIAEEPINAADLNAVNKDGFYLNFKDYSDIQGNVFDGKLQAIPAHNSVPNNSHALTYYLYKPETNEYIVLTEETWGEPTDVNQEGSERSAYQGYKFTTVSEHKWKTEYATGLYDKAKKAAEFQILKSYDFNDTDSLIVTMPFAAIGQMPGAEDVTKTEWDGEAEWGNWNEDKGVRVYVSRMAGVNYLTVIEYAKANDRLAIQQDDAYAGKDMDNDEIPEPYEVGANAPYIEFGKGNNQVVDMKAFVGKLWNITSVDGSMIMSPEVSADIDSYDQLFAPAKQVDLTNPEGQWLLNREKNANDEYEYYFVNRESGAKWYVNFDKNYATSNGTWVLRNTGVDDVYEISWHEHNMQDWKWASIIIKEAGEPGLSEKGYVNFDMAAEANNGKYMSFADALGRNVYIGKDADDNVILTEDQNEAIEFRIKQLGHDFVDHDGEAAPDTLRHYTTYLDLDKDGNVVSDTDTLQFFQYALYENFSEKYLTYDETTKNFKLSKWSRTGQAHENFEQYGADNAFVVKEKEDGTRILVREYAIDYDWCHTTPTKNHILGEDWDDNGYTFDNIFEVNFGDNANIVLDKDGKPVRTEETGEYNGNAHKVYAAYLTGEITDNAALYNYEDNDRITVVNTDKVEYMKITGAQDTVKIALQDQPNFFLYEQKGFLGMEHVADVEDMKAAIFVDTAYVTDTYRPRYLMAMGGRYVPEHWDNHPESEQQIPPHLITPDTTYGRFLVNMVDSAVTYKGSVKTNPYIHEELNGNHYYRLAFIDGFYTGNKLYLNDKKTVIALDEQGNDNLDKVCTFAFRYVDNSRTGVKIETRYNTTADDVPVRGWLKYQNNVAVVTNDYNDAHVFTVDNTTLEAPTANEEITAEGAVSVVATDGAVIIKGAEGKNVVIATILGKVVANETVNSDNETIAVPAGIAVVSVDGESFKVVVK